MFHRRSLRPLALALVCAGAAAVASAQPKLVITGIYSDLAAGGDRVAGLVSVDLNGADSDFSTVPMTWTRGVGYALIPGAKAAGQYKVVTSADLSSLALSAENLGNWGDLNCFNGYCFGNMTGCTPGDPRPPLDPCTAPGVTHRWTMATGWTNAGSFERILDSATGRYYGGTRCDYDINSPNDMSGDGRFIVGGAWWARLTTMSGGPGFGLCGDFFAFRYDSLTGAFDRLPASSDTTRADRVNHDGSVISGYELHYEPFDSNGDGIPDGIDSWRKTAVWRNNVLHIIDPYRGAKDSAAINAPGTMVASGASTQFVTETFPGENGPRLVRWTWQTDQFVPENLGRPIDFPDPSSGVGIPFSNLYVTDISADGNTILGWAQYGAPPPTVGGLQRPFIWRPTINGGVPIDLATYLNSIAAGSPIFDNTFLLERATALSADGNQILVRITDRRNTCPFGFGAPISHITGHAGIVYLDGNIPCEPPRIGLGPESWNDTGGLPYGVSLNVVASGSWPLNFQWQREDPMNPGSWINLTESCQGFTTAADWNYEGVFKNQLRIGIGSGYASRAGNYRVVVSNACGSVASDPAEVTFTPGACCFPGGICELGFFYTCSAQTNGGSFQGSGSTCTPTICADRACCIGQTCIVTDALTCAANEGTPGEEGSTCAPDPCAPPTTGACCCGSSCTITTAAACTGANRAFAGAGTSCTPFSNTAPCCRGDYNKTGAPATVQDIFDFLAGYFSADPCADSNDSGGAPTVQDIFDYLSAYFGGGC